MQPRERGLRRTHVLCVERVPYNTVISIKTFQDWTNLYLFKFWGLWLHNGSKTADTLMRLQYLKSK